MNKFEEQILGAIKDGLMFSIRDSQIVSILMSDIKGKIHVVLKDNCNMAQDKSKLNETTETNIGYSDKSARNCRNFARALRICANEHEKDVTPTGNVIVSHLCRDVADFLDKLEQDNKLRKAEIEAVYECGKHANKWVSVDERLPEKNGAYLCTVNFADHSFFELAGFANDLSKVVDDYALQNCKYPGWYVSDPEMGYYEMTNIVAWMELPEIYKAKEGE